MGLSGLFRFFQLSCFTIKRFFKFILFVLLLALAYLLVNAAVIYRYSKQYSEQRSDVAIVLGAAVYGTKVSPVYRERINHAIYLYQQGIIKKIILTGGKIEGQKISDSRVAMNYAKQQGVPEKDILIEESSRYTEENLQEAKKIMEARGYTTALLVSDPLHMKRGIHLADDLGLNCQPSPTQTSMYRTLKPRAKSLLYESIFLSAQRLRLLK